MLSLASSVRLGQPSAVAAKALQAAVWLLGKAAVLAAAGALIQVEFGIIGQAPPAIPGLAKQHRLSTPRHEVPVPSCFEMICARAEAPCPAAAAASKTI